MALLGSAAEQYKASSGRHALLVIDGADLLVKDEDFVETLVLRAKARRGPFQGTLPRALHAADTGHPPHGLRSTGPTAAAFASCSCRAMAASCS